MRPAASVASSINGLTFFTDRTAFNGACPSLPVEDFEESTLGAGGIVGVARPLNATTNNAYYNPGDILPGLSITTIGPDRGGLELAYSAAGFGGTPSDDVYANFFVDHLAVDLTSGTTTGVGMDLGSIFLSDPNLNVDIYGTSGLIGSTTAPGTPAGVFWGVRADQVITQIQIRSAIDQAEGVDNVAFGQCIIFVDVDIKPGSFPNSINPKSNGVVPVAILGSAEFDVTDVDVTTLAFGPAGASPAHDLTDPITYADHLQDVNGDGFTDLVSHYRQKQTGIAVGDTDACLTGATLGGIPIEGCDSVRVLGG